MIRIDINPATPDIAHKAVALEKDLQHIVNELLEGQEIHLGFDITRKNNSIIAKPMATARDGFDDDIAFLSVCERLLKEQPVTIRRQNNTDIAKT